MSTKEIEGKGETVTTWANGFGVWHAKVEFPYPGYGDYLDEAIGRIRRKAVRAIRREIIARETTRRGKPRFRCYVEVADNHQDAQGRFTYITYRERV
jgi:hypothetical protein